MPKRRAKAPPKELAQFPMRVKYAREIARMTMTALAEKTGLQTSQLSRIESGEGSNGVEAATAIRIARGLGQPIGWLLANEGVPNVVPVIRETDGRKLRYYPKRAAAESPAPGNVRRR